MPDIDPQEALNIQIRAMENSYRSEIAGFAARNAALSAERDILLAKLSKAEQEIQSLKTPEAPHAPGSPTPVGD